jgi:hypothetical protein
MRLQSETQGSVPRAGAARESPGSAVTIEVIAYAPAAFFHCMHCEVVWQASGLRTTDRREQLDSSLPEDLKAEYQRLSDWVRATLARHGERVRFRIVDAASVEGWCKSVWYRVRRYPAVIVDRKEKSVGPELERATALIERRLAALTIGVGGNDPSWQGRVE